MVPRVLAASLALIGAPVWALDVNALPGGGKLVAGNASIGQAANVLTVQQTSQRAALDWQSFNISAAARVNFVQPNSSAVALNRIAGEASQIYGTLSATGQVFFSNPNGMAFARAAQVNVGGILATTLKLGVDDFMAGNYRFTSSDTGAGSGSIRNQDVINALGSVALLGNTVHNAEQIIATTVTLAAGNSVAVDLSGDGLIRTRVIDAALKARIENSGRIAGAQVTLSAGQVREALDRLVNNSGVIRSTGLSMQGGEMVLRPDSQLQVQSYAFSAAKPAEDNFVFSMLRGGLRTVTGLIGKRGTQFDLRVCLASCGALADGTYLAVRFGAVQTSNAQGSLAVAAGQVAFVPPRQAPVMLPRDPGIGFTPPAVIPKLDEKKKLQSMATSQPAESGSDGGAKKTETKSDAKSNGKSDAKPDAKSAAQAPTQPASNQSSSSGTGQTCAVE